MAQKLRLGELLVQKNLVSKDNVETALKLQIGGNRRLGHLLIKMKLLTDDQLIDVLSSQLNLPITDISRELKGSIKKIIPRYLCQKYSVLPLREGENNTLDVAMIDPSDDEAIQAVEDYTNRAVKPVLARGKDINQNIIRYVPLSLQDIFNPQSYTNFSKFASGVAIVAVTIIAVLSYQYIQTERYGTMTLLTDASIYKNHDIMININNDNGKIALLGHGAYADGYYSVTFSSLTSLESFINKNKSDLSVKQHEWLSWLIQKKLPVG